MYNGVGLPTPRGSGTSGHVQRNCAISFKKEKKKHTEVSKLDPINRQPNKEILEHTRKREIEVKCFELSDALEEEGYTQEEIDIKVTSYRKILLENYEKSKKDKKHTDEYGRPIVHDSHQSAEAQLERNAKLRDAFGLSKIDESNLNSEAHSTARSKNKS
ncbi:PREDICTED: pre-mRNA-splicing factor CWC21-like [Ceratosolen solmsi marchali]|uniref:Pre-mRNA-splicing factor CWC21-like n=1 Tax=Ceratosolen solmsi marchali TaxID=326594 RepID=A0AAJ6YMB4_9HYME|nr:PREDICTED: pre-mRNA-splicing factor CWC21-like [Ceratosolen solmsi marchali]